MAQEFLKVAATSSQLENVLQPDVQNQTREELSARSDLVFQATATWTDRYGQRSGGKFSSKRTGFGIILLGCISCFGPRVADDAGSRMLYDLASQHV